MSEKDPTAESPSSAAAPSASGSTGPGERNKGEWRRSAQTRKAVLDAARQLFNDRGYDNTGIHDIVTASGVSVGSIYHQFGGKPEIFRALIESTQARHTAISQKATAKAIAAGETDPFQIYVAGAKAYLMDTWSQRGIDRVTILLEGPTDVVSEMRVRIARFLHGSQGLKIGDPPLPESTSYAIYGLLLAAATQLMNIDDRRTAKAIVDYFGDLILRLGHQP